MYDFKDLSKQDLKQVYKIGLLSNDKHLIKRLYQRLKDGSAYIVKHDDVTYVIQINHAKQKLFIWLVWSNTKNEVSILSKYYDEVKHLAEIANLKGVVFCSARKSFLKVAPKYNFKLIEKNGSEFWFEMEY